MAVQKNFIIRNGLEVNNNLLVADINLDRVGIGTSTPKSTLEVIGGIGVTDINVLGIGTVLTKFNVGSGGTVITSLNSGLTGFGTVTPAYVVDIRSPVSTGQTALYVQGDIRVTGDIFADDINFDQATLGNLQVTGISTLGNLQVSSGVVTATSGIVTYYGDGSKLTGVISGVGINTAGGVVGTGATVLTFVGSGVSTITVSSGIATITISGGGGGGTPGGSDTQVQYNSSGTFAGSANLTFNGTSLVVGAATTINSSGILSPSGIGSFGSINADTGRVTTGIVTNLRTTGIASVGTGIVTTLSGSNISFTGIGSFGSINADTGRVTTGIVTNLITTGIASVGTGIVTTLSGSNISYSGIGSFGSINADTGRVITGIVTNLRTTGIASVGTGIVTTLSGSNISFTGIGSFGSINADTGRVTTGIVTNLITTGIASVGTGIVTNLSGSNLNYSGISTLGTVRISSGIVTATSGVVTYYGDGSKLTGISVGSVTVDGQAFNTGITSAFSAILTGIGATIFTVPSTAGKEYIVYSIHAANVGLNTEVNAIGAFDFNGGERSYFAYNIPIPTGTAVELLNKPQILNPSDRIVMRATDYDRVGIDSGVQVYVTYQEKTATDYFGLGFGPVGINTTIPIGIYTATTYPAVLESIRLTNTTDLGGYPISVTVTSGVTTRSLVDNLIVPKYANVELLETPKRLNVNDVLKIQVQQLSSVDVQISGKQII